MQNPYKYLFTLDHGPAWSFCSAGARDLWACYCFMKSPFLLLSRRGELNEEWIFRPDKSADLPNCRWLINKRALSQHMPLVLLCVSRYCIWLPCLQPKSSGRPRAIGVGLGSYAGLIKSERPLFSHKINDNEVLFGPVRPPSKTICIIHSSLWHAQRFSNLVGSGERRVESHPTSHPHIRIMGTIIWPEHKDQHEAEISIQCIIEFSKEATCGAESRHHAGVPWTSSLRNSTIFHKAWYKKWCWLLLPVQG
jgi:hypothetical protein